MRFLIIEDDAEIVETISLALDIGWPSVDLVSTHSGEEGLEILSRENFDVIILDLGLPDISGFEVLKRTRAFSNVPVVIISVANDEASVVRGLGLGADDYVAKPFRQMELLARVKAQLPKSNLSGETAILYGAMRLEPGISQLYLNQKEIPLTPTEFRILYCLMRNINNVVTHQKLAEMVWSNGYEGAQNAIKVYIRRLRKKLEEDPSRPKLIQNKPGVGYFIGSLG